jgi:hypothetical protein
MREEFQNGIERSAMWECGLDSTGSREGAVTVGE